MAAICLQMLCHQSNLCERSANHLHICRMASQADRGQPIGRYVFPLSAGTVCQPSVGVCTASAVCKTSSLSLHVLIKTSHVTKLESLNNKISWRRGFVQKGLVFYRQVVGSFHIGPNYCKHIQLLHFVIPSMYLYIPWYLKF